MNNKAFSIIEVMIGVAILSGMSLLLFSITNSMLNGKQRAETRNESLHALRIAFTKINEDLLQAFTANKGLKGTDQFFETGMKGSENSLYFSTMSHLHLRKDDKDTDHITVGYSLKKNEKGNSDLVRHQSRYLTEKLDEGGKTYLLLENVKELLFEYYDSNKKDWVRNWDTSRVSVLGRLPEAVKVTITFLEFENEDDEEAIRETSLSTTTLIPMYNNEIFF